LQLVWARLDGADGLYEPPGRIGLDCRLGRLRRSEVLAHELVHDERAGGCDLPGMPSGWQAVVASDEAAVDDEVARRLVPVGELGDYCRAQVAIGYGVTAAETAEYFDVTEDVAYRALKLWMDFDRPNTGPADW
jgi:hypothetical protein